MVQRRPLIRSGATRELPAGDTLLAEGYAFPAVSVASTDPYTLDDYEELAWTPALSFATIPSGLTYGTARYGKATKIGRQVFLEGRMILTSKGLLGGGLVSITGLPFAAALQCAAGGFRYLNVALTAGNVMGGYVSASVLGLQINGAAGSADLTWAMLTNTTDIMFQAAYNV